jgi:hypothetical protein
MATTLSRVFGVVFLAVGILGFFNDPILGLFDVDLEHNIVHLAAGVVLLACAGRAALTVVGLVYLLVAVLGFVMGEGELLGLVRVNQADNWLHVVLAVAMLVAAKAPSPAAPAPMA